MTADAAQLEPYRTALTGHCYRMLGSVTDAEDAVQETMVKAWQNLDRFEGRASLKTWLYRIATNVCLDALSDRSRRFRPMEEGEAASPDDELIARPHSYWIEPIPDARAVPADASPLEKTMLRQSIRLAFVAALQLLPPRQRAALLLTEVLGWSAAEVAECVEMTVAAVNSALQRARATLASRNTALGLRGERIEALEEAPEEAIVNRYVDAFHRYDVDALVSLLRDDAVMTMPPYAFWLRGPESIRGWLNGRGSVCRGSRLVPIEASGSVAFGHYHSAGHAGGAYLPWGIIVLETGSDGIASWNTFLDTETLFPMFGLPPSLPALSAADPDR